MTLPDLEAWAIFAHIADAGSFTAAAETTGLSKATISKAISRLERSLGVALFHRTSRRLSLTEAGGTLSANARAILEAGIQAEAGAGASRMGMAGLIRMTAPVGYGSHVVAPALADFLAQHSDLKIDLRLHDRRPDFTADRLDLAVASTINLSTSDNLDHQPLDSFKSILVAAPAYLAANGDLSHPTELTKRRCLVDPRYGTVWRFTDGSVTCDVTPAAVLSVDDDAAILSAARLGLGAARVVEDLVANDIAQGTLLPLLDGWACPSVDINLVSAHARLRPRKVTELMKYLTWWTDQNTRKVAGNHADER